MKEITQEMQSNLLALAKSLKGRKNLCLKNHIDKLMDFPELYNIDHQVLEYCDELIDGSLEDAENLRKRINASLPVVERSTYRK